MRVLLLLLLLLVVGIFGILAVMAAAIFFLVHKPLEEQIADQAKKNAKLSKENKKIDKRTKDFDKLKAAFEAAQTQAASIATLNNARATPANFLFELGNLLKRKGDPTVSAAMQAKLKDNENLRWNENWDPKHVWIDSIVEKETGFTIVGQAQSDGDVTQLAHRLAASIYFENVQPEGSKKVIDKKTGITLYSFTITGTVRY